MPHFTSILEFIDVRARASESTVNSSKQVIKPDTNSKKPVTSFVANSHSRTNCVIRKNEQHPLYHCQIFKNLTHDERLSITRTNNYCMNCLRPGHFSKECKLSHRYRKCQKLHHTLLHVDNPQSAGKTSSHPSTVSSNTATGVINDTQLMTCQVIVSAPDGSKVRVRGLLESASSMSFISQRLVQSPRLPQSNYPITISGIAGLTDHCPLRSITKVKISSTLTDQSPLSVSAIVVSWVTCNLPVHPVSYKFNWKHLSDIPLADPEFGQPGKIDLLLGIDVYANVLLPGQLVGAPGSPVAFETIFGWVLAGKTTKVPSIPCIVSHHVTVLSSIDNVPRQFWEIEEPPSDEMMLSVEEREKCLTTPKKITIKTVKVDFLCPYLNIPMSSH